MSRPCGSGLFDDLDVATAIALLGGGHAIPPRWSVALEVGCTEAALKSRHRRRGLTWRQYATEVVARFAPLSGTLDGLELGDDGAMKGVVVRLEPAVADALLRLARSEERPVQAQAARLLREGLRRHGVLPSREPQPLRSAPSDAA